MDGRAGSAIGSGTARALSNQGSNLCRRGGQHEKLPRTERDSLLERYVCGRRSVDQEPSADLDGWKQSRHRAAGEQRSRCIARSECDGLARVQCGRHDRKRDRRVLEAREGQERFEYPADR